MNKNTGIYVALTKSALKCHEINEESFLLKLYKLYYVIYLI